MEYHVYYDSFQNTVSAFVGVPSWVSSRLVFIGVIPFDKTSEPTHASIREWAVPRIKLLELPISTNLPAVFNYASHAYWGNHQS